MKTETTIVRQGLDRLRRLLPVGWVAEVVDGAAAVDGLVRVTSPDGVTGTLAVEAKRRLPPGAVVGVRAQLERIEDAQPVVFSGWLSPLTRHALVQDGVGYLDLTGNVDLRLARPGLYLRDVGADRDPEPAPSALKSLKGAGAARAVRALVDFAPPYGVRELAAASGASPALVSRVVGLLEREQLVVRDASISAVDWEKVLRRWAEDYAFTRANRVVTCLDPRGTAAFVRKLGSYEPDWAATGTLGVPSGVRVVPIQLAAIYVRSPEQTIEQLELTPTVGGANVLLVESPDEGAFARADRGPDGVVRCAPSQVVVDLLTGPGRGSSEATALVEWMKRHETSWRRRP
jgi:hypothetical protein